MCDCAFRKHQGIECGEAGCTCHPSSPSMWVLPQALGFVLEQRNEADVADKAERLPYNIYFFATLT